MGAKERRSVSVRLATAALVAAATLLVACTYNPRRPASGWSAHESGHVVVYSSTLVAHEYPQQWLETAFHAYQSSFFKGMKLHPLEAMFLQVEPGANTRVYLPNDDPPDAWSLETMPGGGRIGHDGLIVLTERRDYRGASRQVAYQLIGQAIPNAPLWLRIGFAQYLSEYRVHYRGNGKGEDSQSWMVCYGSQYGFRSPSQWVQGRQWPPGAPSDVADHVPGRDVLIPIDEILHSDWYQYANDRRYWFNYTAYAFVSYLIHGRDAWHASRFPLLLKALAEGKSSEDALAEAYPHLLPDELDEEVANYVRTPYRAAFWSQMPQGLCFPIPSAAYVDQRPSSEPVAPGDIQAALDDLKRLPVFRHFGSWYPTDVLYAVAGKLEHTPLPTSDTPNRPNLPDPRTQEQPLR